MRDGKHRKMKEKTGSTSVPEIEKWPVISIQC